MNSITDYQDYRQYMREFYEERKRVSDFSWREFTKLAGFSSSGYLKLVCDGKTRLSRVGAMRVAGAMNLAGYQAEYFSLMVDLCEAPNDVVRLQVFERMCALAKKNKVHVVGAESVEYFGSWVNPLVRELAPIMPGAKPSEIAKRCLPEATVGEVRNALELMLKLGLLEKDGVGNYRQVNRWLSNGGAPISLSLQSMQKQLALLAADALDSIPKEDRNISGLTFGADEKAYERIVDEANKFRRTVMDIVSNVKKYDRVYRLNLQLFPLSRKGDSENE
ncbi:TIGR02147 family protein [Fibrobacter sp.]|uniref:TIGR02147 family protein n=1 Tax=Fibrobacter sp. TaxID=35828 RepID=UPI001AFFCB04|nr:TIGR02147 family protein [Fibrobacter sp.]MBO7061257.1 TIGR02147 family protein [Fibrobacter sp.]MBO7105095.1 TIGR02147 family protein [Fibrobacter sp.]MBR3670047.1 TIGR02147 family protein [Fibrobacter sp.]